MDRVSNCTPGYDVIQDPVRYKVVFFSSAAIGIPFLEALCANPKFIISGVVTQPDQPSGRGMQIKANIVKSTADKLLIKQIITPNTLKLDSKKYPHEGEKIAERISNIQPDFLVVIAYGKIIPQHILNAANIAPINVHGSLLPYYRGASPIQTALLNGDKQTGITIMKMNAALDEGDIINQLTIPLTCKTTAQDIIASFGKLGPNFLCKTLTEYAKGNIISHPQNHLQATYTTKIAKHDGEINPHQTPIETIIRKYNAYHLWPKVSFIIQEKRHIIDAMQVDCHMLQQDPLSPLIDANGNLHPCVQRLTIIPENKKAIIRDERKRGYLKSSH